ncbi:MAG: YihY/virulence factor BrkB family protein [Candidatus Acidiferrales bacterium]
MDRFLKCLFRGFGRLFPDGILLGQAIAFNMFLAFFPMLLFILGLLSSSSVLHNAARDLQERLVVILPPGSEDVVTAYLTRRTVHTWKWLSLGFGGTLLAGSQVMLGYIEGFRMIEGDVFRASYLRRNARALLLLVITLVPSLAVIYMTVFGKQFRAWLIRHIGLPWLIREVGFLLYGALVFALAMLVLVAIYRIGRPGHRGYRDLLPGAAVATVLWWTADISFGFYVRRMPYDVVYGGLAAAIGLILWMYLSALIVLLGAAFNAEHRESAGAPDPLSLLQ